MPRVSYRLTVYHKVDFRKSAASCLPYFGAVCYPFPGSKTRLVYYKHTRLYQQPRLTARLVECSALVEFFYLFVCLGCP